MDHNKFYFCSTGNKMCHRYRQRYRFIFCAPCYVCKVVRRFSHIHRRVICS